MFGYYLALGLRQLRRNPVLTALMVVTLAVGIAASMATLTVLRAMSGDPIPDKSDRLFVPLLDIRPNDGGNTDEPEPPTQLGYRDVLALRNARRGIRQSALYQIAPIVDVGRANLPAYFGSGLAIDRDFFGMMDVPFVRGGAWTADDDRKAAAVVALRESTAARLFGDVDPIGRTLRLDSHDYVVTGVVADAWQPLPHFYRLVGGPGAFGGNDDVFVPFSTAIANEMNQEGQVSCFSEGPPDTTGFESLKQGECVWLQLWVELGSASDADAYRAFMAGYVAEQRKLGRFPRPDNQRLHDVPAWLARNRVVSKDTRLQTYLAFGFLLVCLVNTIGLLLAKFTARSGEIGVRRALGARRRSIFQQYLVEAGVIGLAGGVIGLGLTLASLWLIGRQSEQLAALAHMNWSMLVTTFALSVSAAVLAGLLPTWRACQVLPALQLKSQ